MVMLETVVGGEVKGMDEMSVPDMPVHTSFSTLPVAVQDDPDITVMLTPAFDVAPELSIAFAVNE